MSKAGLFDRAATATLVLCAIVVTVLLVRKELRRGTVSSAIPATTPTLQEDWVRYAKGHVLGPSNVAVTIVEFADFECPFCRRFHEYADSLWALGVKFRVIYRHFPLSNHRFAIPAARVSECASEQGRFAEMHRTLYVAADSVGLAPWSWFASQAGIVDTASFHACVGAGGTPAAVERDIRDAKLLGAEGTPLLLVGKWRFAGVPPFDTLHAYIIKAQSEGLDSVNTRDR